MLNLRNGNCLSFRVGNRFGIKRVMISSKRLKSVDIKLFLIIVEKGKIYG